MLRVREVAPSAVRWIALWREATAFRLAQGETCLRLLERLGLGNWNSLITYDASQQKVMLNGTTTVALTSPLSGDMNIGSIASNYLYDYPLNGGGTGNTGDMKSVTFAYGPDSYIRTNQWTPVPGLTGTSPTDASYDVTLTDWGQINRSDPNLATVSKPTVERELVSTNPTTRMIVCCNWDSTAVGYWYDNIASRADCTATKHYGDRLRISEYEQLDAARPDQSDRNRQRDYGKHQQA